MSLFTRNELMQRASSVTLAKSADQMLAESAKSFRTIDRYDIFLSHSFADAKVILGLKKVLEDHGLTVYVDWIDDSQLDRSKVTPETAAVLRERMRVCKSLLYASSPNATSSRWMPWELGYFDGFNGKVAVVPIVDNPQGSFAGQEYLGLYPYVDHASATDGTLRLWINKGRPSDSLTVQKWLAAA